MDADRDRDTDTERERDRDRIVDHNDAGTTVSLTGNMADDHSSSISSSVPASASSLSSHRLYAPFTFWYLNKSQLPSTSHSHHSSHSSSHQYQHQSHRPGPGAADQYGSAIRDLATFDTVEQFWSYYTHLRRPDEQPPTSRDHSTSNNNIQTATTPTTSTPSAFTLHLFRTGITPMWEDRSDRRATAYIRDSIAG